MTDTKTTTEAPKPKIRAIVDAELFWRAGFCVSTDETRYYLTGTRIEPEPIKGGAVMVSTNGQALVAFRDPNAFIEGAAIVSLSASMSSTLKALVSSVPAKTRGGARSTRNSRSERLSPTSIIKLVIEDNRAALIEFESPEIGDEQRVSLFERLTRPDVSVRAMQLSELIIDGTYPDWRCFVTADPKPGIPVGALNHDLVRNVVASLSVRGSVPCARLVALGDKNGPALVRGGSSEIDGFGIIMPMRSNALSCFPAWIETASMKKAAEEARKQAEAEKAAAEEAAKQEVGRIEEEAQGPRSHV